MSPLHVLPRSSTLRIVNVSCCLEIVTYLVGITVEQALIILHVLRYADLELQ